LFLERMRTALTVGAGADIGEAAHRLKRTVAFLGAPQVMDALGLIEQISRSGDLAGADRAIEQLDEQIEVLKRALEPHRAAMH